MPTSVRPFETGVRGLSMPVTGRHTFNLPKLLTPKVALNVVDLSI